MDDILVEARLLSRSYGTGRAGVTALASATFRIDAGDQIALVGPSGSGKSTLLHLIGGLDRPTSGDIAWPALGSREELRPGPVTLAFQGPSLLPPLTVLENIELPLLLAGWDRASAGTAAEALLDRFEIGGVADKLPEELSGGQAQRAAIARALAGGPRLVLADEPTGQQDRATGARVMDVLLDTVGASGAAIVVATHDRAVADRLECRWSIDAGILEAQDAPCSP